MLGISKDLGNIADSIHAEPDVKLSTDTPHLPRVKLLYALMTSQVLLYLDAHQ